ncbi:alpha/beta fold hydrolase [Ruegeria lacuscaerulensis]|uniref:alpha/beta fold hydrolase n=1 Tax=Ruegeria lacuscaerulensis TaxID=55218 RepID=UPI00147DB4A9|nr:alpha/beta fold hydrolase [Ruegeria lacuscaerulensis]
MNIEPQQTEKAKMVIRTADVWGRPVRYADYHPESAGQTLLLFNGIGANIESAERFITSFENVRVIIFDAPGVGGTPTPTLPYRLSHVADMAASLLNQLDIYDVHVFGVSWGGGAAQQFAHMYGNRVLSLTLAATAAGAIMIPGSPKTLLKMVTPKRHSDPTFMIQNALTLYGGTVAVQEELMREFSEALDHGTPVGYMYQLSAIVGWTSWHYLPKLKMPALVLMGEDDPIVPIANGRILASRLDRGKLEVMPCGHLFMVTMPVETAQRVERFIFEPH